MSDLISRQAVLREFTCLSDDAFVINSTIQKIVKKLPSVEPERKTGKWMWNNHLGEYECSECGCNPIYERTTPDNSEIDKYRYCRWCGAPMEGSE